MKSRVGMVTLATVALAWAGCGGGGDDSSGGPEDGVGGGPGAIGTQVGGCPAGAPLDCGFGCCPFGEGSRTDVCCSDSGTCTLNGICGGGGCPGGAPLDCGFGCCPFGGGGRTDVCCSDGTCTSNGLCGGGGGCPGDTPIDCGFGCCPTGENGRGDVCCSDTSTCTANGLCAAGIGESCDGGRPCETGATCVPNPGCPWVVDTGASMICYGPCGTWTDCGQGCCPPDYPVCTADPCLCNSA